MALRRIKKNELTMHKQATHLKLGSGRSAYGQQEPTRNKMVFITHSNKNIKINTAWTQLVEHRACLMGIMQLRSHFEEENTMKNWSITK